MGMYSTRVKNTSSKSVTGKSPRYYTDLSRCLPSSAISRKTCRRQWRAVEYEAEDFSGVMLMSGPESRVPNICMPLLCSGWYAIFLGLYSLDPRENEGIRVRLSSDKVFSLVKPEPTEIDVFDRIDEVYWKSADLSGQSLVISHPQFSISSYIAYIKVILMSDMPFAGQHYERVLMEKKCEDTNPKRLIAMNDGFGILGVKRAKSRAELCEDIEPYRDTDVGKLYWCVGSGGDVYTSTSKIASTFGDNVKAFPRPIDRKIRESIITLRRRRVNMLKTVIDYGRSVDLKVYLSLRLEAFACSPPRDTIFTGDLYNRHPEWRCCDRDGVEICRMSYAYPGMQDYVISLLVELSEFKPDGLSLLFPRGAPYLLYEKILIDGYSKRHGVDPRTLDEYNKSWLNYKAEIMTGFIRKVRKAIHPDIALSVHTLNDEPTNLFYGLDVESWIGEGLVNEVVAYPWNDQPVDVDYYVQIVKNSSCKLFVELFPRNMEPGEYQSKAIELYNKGVDGLCLWDTNARHTQLRQWSMIRRLGHKEELMSWDSGEGTFYKTVQLRSIGSCRVDRYSPAWSF